MKEKEHSSGEKKDKDISLADVAIRTVARTKPVNEILKRLRSVIRGL